MASGMVASTSAAVAGPRFASKGARRSVRASASGAPVVQKPTLIDVPVSNHGARVRHVIYHKGLEKEFDVVSPVAFGGLGSEQYKATVNPQNKMPVLLMPDGTVLPESEVIVQYILDKWSGSGPSMRPATPELRALAALAARVHDQYVTPIQACLYRKFEAAERAAMLEQLVRQLDVLESLCLGPYFAGEEPSAGDSALLPTFAFLNFILPRYFGWGDVFAGRPKLAAWWARLQQDEAARRVVAEVTGGLEGWAAKNRWEDLGITQQLAAHPELKWVYP